jgi:hypothetical protein
MKMAKRIVLIVAFSLAGAMIMYLYNSASLRGMFVRWEPLGRPPGKAIKVLALGYVQTEAGTIYQHVNGPGCGDDCWVKSDNFPPNSEFGLPSSACGNLPALERFVDSKAVCEHWGPGVSLSIEAIDNLGYVYSWNHMLGEGDYTIHLFSPLIGVAAGFLVGIPFLLAILFSDLLKWLRKRAAYLIGSDSTARAIDFDDRSS